MTSCYDLFNMFFMTQGCFPNPKSTGLFCPGTALWGVFSIPLCKMRCRHPRELKLIGLIVYIIFYKICKFESSTITNDVIMTSLQNNGKILTSVKQKKIDMIRKVLMRAIQKCTFIEFEPLCQKLWAFLSNFGFFTMPAHQI